MRYRPANAGRYSFPDEFSYDREITPDGLTPVPGIERTSQEFRQRVIEIAADLGTDPNYLMAIMSFESNLDPASRNPYSGATGLIQFMPSTAAQLGTSTAALASMTAEQQLEYVARYFAPYRGRLSTLEDAYMAVLWPAAIGRGPDFVLFSSPSTAYQQNRALDLDQDGRITVGEATSFVRRRLGGAAPPSGGGTQPGGTGPLDRRSREYIRWVQQSLNRILRLRLVVDGISGPKTKSAIRSFQRQQGLAVDGIVGPITEAALIRAGAGGPPTASAGPAPSSPAAPDIVSVRGIQVARSIAPRVEQLLAAAERDGIRLGGGGYRSADRQIALRRQHCGTSAYDIYQKPSSQCNPPTARPGTSRHEQGLAIDFTQNGRSIDSGSGAFRWLQANAGRYGLRNLPSEPWHWSIDGR